VEHPPLLETVLCRGPEALPRAKSRTLGKVFLTQFFG
jgi:hypothetical protein